MPDEKFAAAMAFVRKWEGGWSDHKADPGGLTKWGVTIKTLIAKALDFNRDGRVNEKDLADMTVEQAEALYRSDYFDACRCGDLPAPVAVLVFDCAVNQGPSRSGKFLQQAVGASVDGAIGDKTVAKAIAAFAADERAVLREFQVRRALHYSALATFATFGLGWFRRLVDGVIEAARLGVDPAAQAGGPVQLAPRDQALAEFMADVAASAEAAARMAREAADASDGVVADLRDKAIDLQSGAV